MTDFPLGLEQRFVHAAIDKQGLDIRFHHVTTSVRINGPIRVDHLIKAVVDMSLAHPVFRTLLTDDGLAQRSHPEPVSVGTLDAAGMSDDDVAELFSRRGAEPFDLSTQYPVRITVAMRQENEAILVFNAHHMFFDATGLDIALTECLHRYEQLLSGNRASDSVAVAETPDYLTYVRNQPAQMEGRRVTRKLAYWQKDLAGAEPKLHFPARSADPSFVTMRRLPFRLDLQHSAKIIEHARQHRVTPFTLLTGAALAAFGEVSDQDDITMAIVTDTRSHAYLRCIGQFADMALLRRPLVRDLDQQELRSIFAKLLGIRTQQLQSEYLRTRIEWLERRTRSYGGSEVLINYITNRARQDFPHITGHEVSRFPLAPSSNNQKIPYFGLALGFQIIHQSDGLDGIMSYDSGVMSDEVADTIHREFVARLHV